MSCPEDEDPLTRACHVCGAEVGDRCFSSTFDGGVFVVDQTRRSYAMHAGRIFGPGPIKVTRAPDGSFVARGGWGTQGNQ